MNETSPKPFVFVLMPFDPAFDDVYKLGIKDACADAGAYGERVDEQVFDETILQRVYNQIAKADLIVSDMTGRNPNVFYETGYAHALGQRVILLTQRADDIPFDLKHHQHIVYGGKIAELKEELTKRIRWALAHPRTALQQYAAPIEMYLDGHPLQDNPVLRQLDHGRGFIRFMFDAENPVRDEIRSVGFQIAIITPPCFSHTLPDHREPPRPGIKTPEGALIHVLEDQHGILPGAWTSGIRVDLLLDKSVQHNTEYQMTLRVFSDTAPKDFPFRLILSKPEPKR